MNTAWRDWLLPIGGLLFLLSPREAGAQRPLCGTRTTAACTAPGLTLQQLSAGFTHSCGVTIDGTGWCWGDGREFALGDGRREVSQFPQRVRTKLPLVSIGAGGNFSCGRTVEGRVVCWGNERVVPGWPEAASLPREVTLTANTCSL